jgi:hypothetical protein
MQNINIKDLTPLPHLKILATQTGERFVVNTMNKNQLLALIGDDFDVNGFLKTFAK